MASQKKCPECTKGFKGAAHKIFCDNCRIGIHRDCYPLEKLSAKKFKEMRDAGHVFPYRCKICTDNTAQPIEPIPPVHGGRERATRTVDRDPDSDSRNKRPRYESEARVSPIRIGVRNNNYCIVTGASAAITQHTELSTNFVASARPREPPTFFRDGFRVDVTTFSTSTPIDGVPHTTTSTTSIVLTPQDYEPAELSSRSSPPIPLVEKSTELPPLVVHLPANPATGATRAHFTAPLPSNPGNGSSRAHLTATLPANPATSATRAHPTTTLPAKPATSATRVRPTATLPANPIQPPELTVAVRNQLTVAVPIQAAVPEEAIPAEGEPLPR